MNTVSTTWWLVIARSPVSIYRYLDQGSNILSFFDAAIYWDRDLVFVIVAHTVLSSLSNESRNVVRYHQNIVGDTSGHCWVVDVW